MKRGFFIYVLCIFSIIGYAQRDTEFWFVCPNIVSGGGSHSDNHMKLCFISYDNPTTITISQPASDPSSFAYFQPQTIMMQANGFHTFDLTPYKSTLKDNSYGAKMYGLLIQADQEIMAYFINTSDDCEAYTLKGQNALGYDFVIPMQYHLDNEYSGHNFVEIVATEDNTEVTITLPRGVSSPQFNVDPVTRQKTITLQRGWTYSFRSASDSGSKHLHNTRITSNKPIAVNSTDDGVDPGDLMGDQILPVEMLGNHYIAIKNDGNTEYVYFFATEDNTNVTITSGTKPTASKPEGIVQKTYTLNSGQGNRYSFSNKSADKSYRAVDITSDKPIVVFQMTGKEPAGAILPQLKCTGSSEVAFQSVLESVWADIVTKKDYIDGFLVNGQSGVIVPDDFDTVPGTEGKWYYSRKELTPKQVLRVSNDKGVFHLGMYDMVGNSSSLAYFSDFRGVELKAETEQNYYFIGDTLVLKLYDATSYTNIEWTTPSGAKYVGNPLEIPNATVDDAGIYVVTAEHLDGCVLAGGTNVPVNVFSVRRQDTTSCAGVALDLHVLGDYAPYEWSTNDRTAEITVYPTDTTDYVATSNRIGVSHVFNGDFQVDTLEFLSGYVYDESGLGGQGHFVITNDAKTSMPQLQQTYDHTWGNTQGKFLLAETDNNAGSYIWHKKIPIERNTQYMLSVWTINPSATLPNANLKFVIDGNPVQTSIVTTNQWAQSSFLWSGSSKNYVDFGIITDNGCPAGALVGVDDMGLSKLVPVSDTIHVDIKPLPTPTITGDSCLCEGKAYIEANEGYRAYSWRKIGGNDLGTMRGITITEPGIYEVEVLDEDGECSGITSVRLDNGITLQMQMEQTTYFCAQDNYVGLPYQVSSGEVARCHLKYDAKALMAGFKEDENALIVGDEVRIPMPNDVKANIYNVDLTFDGNMGCGGKQNFTKTVEIRYDPNQIMNQKWDDVLALYNDQYNGGYVFTACQWYKNGAPLVDETNTYLYLGDQSFAPSDTYTALLTRDDGVTLFSCDFTPNPVRAQIPSYVHRSQPFQAYIPHACIVRIYSLSGQLVSEQNASDGWQELEAPSYRGLCVLQIVEDKNVSSYKLIIE